MEEGEKNTGEKVNEEEAKRKRKNKARQNEQYASRVSMQYVFISCERASGRKKKFYSTWEADVNDLVFSFLFTLTQVPDSRSVHLVTRTGIIQACPISFPY